MILADCILAILLDLYYSIIFSELLNLKQTTFASFPAKWETFSLLKQVHNLIKVPLTVAIQRTCDLLYEIATL